MVSCSCINELSDDILTKILSCLPINSAAATSVLSTRWRHLWTGVTSFIVLFETGKDDDDDILYLQKLIKLTSLKLHNFHIELKSLSNSSKTTNIRDQVSCFREVCRRDVEIINMYFPDEETRFFLFVPDFVFRTKSLVSLSLVCMDIKFDMPENVAIQLPNLKKLHLHHLSHIPPSQNPTTLLETSLDLVRTIDKTWPSLLEECVMLVTIFT
ncbi:putative F-box/FBD/LRR-repeat protein At3g56780 [Spinacia oleracea]|uniref:F-box/FBD/LRR-repeat protein At3g56780 n=1 Tax=Spinacia oleracea TaxID=3562 RepID=A0ABM3RP60_SPIOL|nr:putative F-box/FBD/LRR-repeat protein At3g56780 [Spinacia oleracea]